MKKILLIVGIVSLMVSCDKATTTKETPSAPVNESGFKTAYIDTEKLMKEYQESIDFEAKYKSMSERIQNELSSDMKKFQSDVQDLQRSAQSKGMEWAQKREAELTRRQQTLAEKEQNYMKKFQEEGAVERDSMVSKMKTFIKQYGKEKGYDYVFGTGDAATVLYAKDGYEITEEILKIMNEEYAKSKGTSAKEEPKKEAEAKK
ncbi:OmpH family outer membrane protein [Myroides ceti]|uniref:OmpH family outer membrane protein n=1 Tax=Paenimyroides ceti TaxID=395087 RepID=A0ABT8CZK1_9FLAO|nr:OmpH family outer membrane protein [Paenimyroides ceti]MDN3708625.1 OmpH family outer membrane protein [Paenimyroides ceti]